MSQKISLKLVLVIILIIQPVMFSYAMANMNHEHRTSQTSMQSSHMDHGAELVTGQMHQGVDQTSDSGSEPMNNCCASPACGGAMTSTDVITASQLPFEHLLVTNISRQSITLSSEIKPPKYHSL